MEITILRGNQNIKRLLVPFLLFNKSTSHRSFPDRWLPPSLKRVKPENVQRETERYDSFIVPLFGSEGFPQSQHEALEKRQPHDLVINYSSCYIKYCTLTGHFIRYNLLLGQTPFCGLD